MGKAVENIHTKNVSRCYLCGCNGEIVFANVRDRLYKVPGVWNLRQCVSRKCGLVWLDPMPLESDIWKLYVDYFTHHESNSDGCDSVDIENVRISFLNSKIKRVLFAKYFSYREFKEKGIISLVASFFATFSLFKSRMGRKVMWLNGNWRCRLLDYGCGNGRFLGQMKMLGWSVTGFELDKQAAKIASDAFGVKVYSDSFSSIGAFEEPFDVITLSHVIEHLPDPINTLQECMKLLRPGGRLVIVTPNYDSLGRKIFKDAWRPMETPRHLYLYNINTLSCVVDKTGLEVESIWTHADSASSIWSRSKVIKREGELAGGNPVMLPSYAKKGSKLFSSLERLLSKFIPCGEEMVAIVKRK